MGQPESTSSQQPHAFDASRLARLGRVGAVVPAPCGSWVAVEVARLDEDQQRNITDLWRVPLDGGAPEALTGGPWSDKAPCFRHDGALGFLSDRPQGREKEPKTQVWLLPARGGEPRRLTDEPLGVLTFLFASAADRLVLVAPVHPGVPHDQQRAHDTDRAKNGPTGLWFARPPVRHWDHWIGVAAPHLIACDAGGGGRRDLTPDADRELRPMNLELELTVSSDGRTAVIPRTHPGTGTVDRMEDVDLWVFDLESGAARTMGDSRSAWIQTPSISPDGQQVACVRLVRSREVCGREELWLVDLRTGAERALAPSVDLWLVPSAWTHDGTGLLCLADARCDVPVFHVDVDSGDATRLTVEGSHTSVRPLPGSDSIVGARHRALHPPEPFRLDPGAVPTLLACLSGFTPADGAALATVERLDVPTSDGERVSTLLIRPPGEGPHPTLLWIHGGPMSQWSDGWHWRWCPLVFAAAGYAVALPNPRGSTGAGQTFLEGVWGNTWGARCYEDVIAVADTLAALPDLDATRMAAMGGSFGGYMANWLGANTDRFRCLVSHAGLYHLTAFWGVTDHPSWFESSIGADPLADAAAFDRYSPHTRVQQWKTPTLITHGEKDYRVPVGEALRLFESLHALGVPAELLVFPDEGHWVLRPRNAEAWYRTVATFLERHGV